MNYYNRLGRPESSPNNYHKYVCDITALIAGLAKQRRTVRLLIGDTRWDQDVRTDVRKALEKSGIHSSDGLIIDEPAATVDDILLQLGSVDVVVASRFHNLLLAAILGKPIIALSYHDKIPALMEELGVREFCHDIEDFSSEEVSAQVLKLEDPTIRARFLHRVQARVIDYREMLDDQYRQMFAPFVKTCATDAISNGQWQ
jgi:polysaccharide pyruvyl transferase WcaK-like protein